MSKIMDFKLINPTGNSYAQAFEITKYERLVFVSGQVPADEDDVVPIDFASQCRLVWKNIEAQLESANMDLKNIVKVTTFLSDRKFRDENSKIRHAILGELQPALTVIIAGIYEDFWLLEIEVIAAE
jgi:2-iminobutanoate/2-iminopropanoate deaminase